MQKIQKHIEIVRSTTQELSSMSHESACSLLRVLKTQYETVGITIVNTNADLVKLALIAPDVVFNGVKYVPQIAGSRVKIWVADFLEQNGITVTGSASSAHKLELDKNKAKECVLFAGLPTAQYYVVKRYSTLCEEDIKMEFPVFIKPTSKGGGVGIDNNSVAYNFADAEVKVLDIQSKYNADSLIETYLAGREFSVAILRNPSGGYDVMPLELIAPLNQLGQRILSSEVKYADTEEFIPVTDAGIAESINKLALACFTALGARDYGRIDIRMDSNNIPYFLEANLIPSIIDGYGNFPKACSEYNITFKQAMNRIIDLALQRSSHLLQRGQNNQANINPVANQSSIASVNIIDLV